MIDLISPTLPLMAYAEGGDDATDDAVEVAITPALIAQLRGVYPAVLMSSAAENSTGWNPAMQVPVKVPLPAGTIKVDHAAVPERPTMQVAAGAVSFTFSTDHGDRSTNWVGITTIPGAWEEIESWYTTSR